ncbi:hypothetical protein [Paraflavitalea sp. CAU 1676]|uniref:hypothetical protein n=1 Tax=Paraflavitalea sp. CAU 1676 TaxID=3032598 RepID=UPI0023DAE708|nr:hypothetical protein [Paraflavitalea sp. CAU 1676]MDF2188687.1 hypothetical protein [Paraflavitalea sp. CAU 1676]
MQTHQLSRLMYLSWEIQRTKHNNRSKALTAAWAIVNNADITIHYLLRKHSGSKTTTPNAASKLTLFHS